jgi:hypothetical protein
MENQRNKLWQYLQALPNKASEALLGKPVLDVDSVDLSGVDTTTPEFKENMGGVVDIKVGNNPRVGGLIPDITAGYRENSTRPLEFNNLQTNITPDGRNKGAAYRFGEFAGTAARLLDNPLVRGGIAYGLSKSMGDRRPLVEGLTAAVGTQQNRMKDQMYRQALAERGIDTSGIRGWLGDDTFKYLLEDQQVKDNAAFRELYYKNQQQNQKDLMDFRRWQAEKDVEQNKIDNYYKGQQIAQGWQRIKADQEQNENNKDIQALNEMEAQLDDFVSTFDVVDNPYRYRIAGGVSNALNTLTPEEANFNAKRTLLFNAIARKLAGEKGVLSDQDIKRIDDALPRLSDNKKQKMAKMDATYSLLDIRRGYKTPQAQAGNTTKSGVKYEVID